VIARKSDLRARPIFDDRLDGDENAFRFYVLQGTCRKCRSGPNSLVIQDFKNNKNPRMAIFKTVCLCCGDKDMYFGRDTPKAEDDEPYEVGEENVPTTLNHPPRPGRSPLTKPRT
jgi:hypothetical protein